MKVIEARNVCHAYVAGMQLLEAEGRWEETRNGAALVAPWPVTTVYARPTERVLLAPGRVPNPALHVWEALWMLAGRDDATLLDQFVSDFSARFAEDTGHQWGAYGARWREHFTLANASSAYDDSLSFSTNQLDEVVRQLRANPGDRRAVIQMWDPEVDLGAQKRDLPCNLTALPRIVYGRMHLTVLCRSNDAVWGAYGANAVHFSFLLEYLAARVGVDVGTYTQVSNNLHVYEDQLRRTPVPAHVTDVYGAGCAPPELVPLVDDPEALDDEVEALVEVAKPGGPGIISREWRNRFFTLVAEPLWLANAWRREKNWDRAREAAGRIASPDWRAATHAWITKLERRA